MVQGTESTYENFYLGHLKRVSEEYISNLSAWRMHSILFYKPNILQVRQYYIDNELITCHGACLDIVNSSCAPYNIKVLVTTH